MATKENEENRAHTPKDIDKVLEDALESDRIKEMFEQFVQERLPDTRFAIILARDNNGEYDLIRSERDAILTGGLLDYAKNWWRDGDIDADRRSIEDNEQEQRAQD